ncbi:hypothetical protein ACFO9E_13025 [Streptomyces maoxianensis]|uniref:Uncharacterized protein n=1 Tax=Streptomyces maoxianensis TaxID=1459942 RepID=A0ABV9G345_9ACTN
MRTPEAIEAAHADFAALQGTDDIPRPRPAFAGAEEAGAEIS